MLILPPQEKLVEDTDFIILINDILGPSSINTVSQDLDPIFDIKESQDNKFWTLLKNQKQYCDWLAEHLKIQLVDDWYAVQRTHIRNIDKACKLLSQFENSFI